MRLMFADSGTVASFLKQGIFPVQWCLIVLRLPKESRSSPAAAQVSGAARRCHASAVTTPSPSQFPTIWHVTIDAFQRVEEIDPEKIILCGEHFDRQMCQLNVSSEFCNCSFKGPVCLFHKRSNYGPHCKSLWVFGVSGLNLRIL